MTVVEAVGQAGQWLGGLIFIELCFLYAKWSLARINKADPKGSLKRAFHGFRDFFLFLRENEFFLSAARKMH